MPRRNCVSVWRNALLYLVLILAATALPLGAQANGVVGPNVADRLGIGIHFITPQPGEIQDLRDTGARWIRKDLDWASTETKPGVYDFSVWDKLLAQFEGARLHVLFILCYYNPLYDHGLSPASDEARQAFARWAVAAITHFRGHHILWEIYNEPNFRFWTPRPDPEAYIKLALAVGEAVEEAAPDEKLVGPASAGVDLPFLEACFKAGLLNYWSAVSIHTYVPGDPESAVSDLLRVRLLMRKYMPVGKIIPVIITEWGYSAAWNGMDEQKQAEMLARGWLAQLTTDEPISFWYDWEGGADPKDPEQHFGLIGPPATVNGVLNIPKKPAYAAAQTLTRMLGDFRFNKRLGLDKPEDYALLFTKGSEVRLAVWTTAPPHQATIPASAGSFDVTGVTGENLGASVADRGGLVLTLENQPEYLVPSAPNDLLAIAAAWRRLPEDIEVRVPAELTLRVPVRNPLQKSVRFRVKGRNARSEEVYLTNGSGVRAGPGELASLTVRLQAITRSADPVPASIELEVRGMGRVKQGTVLVADNPLRVTLLPATPTALPVLITSPARDGFSGWLAAIQSQGIAFRASFSPVQLAPGAGEIVVNLPLERAPASSYELGLQLIDENQDVVLPVPASRFCPAGNFSGLGPGAKPSDYELHEEGGAPGDNGLAVALPAEGPPQPGMQVLKLSYTLPPGRATIDLQPADPSTSTIPGEPKALGVWIEGDNSPVMPYLSFIDSSGQLFEEAGGPISWKGWRYVLVFMDAPEAIHSGGANDGVIHYPIHWRSLLALRNGSDQTVKGAVYVTGPTLIYGPTRPALANDESRR